MKQFEIWWGETASTGRAASDVAVEPENNAYDYFSKFVAVEIASNIRQIASEWERTKAFPNPVSPIVTTSA